MAGRQERLAGVGPERWIELGCDNVARALQALVDVALAPPAADGSRRPGAPVGSGASRPPVALRRMRGYSASTYGDAFADVYDEWYPAGADTAVVVEALRRLAGGGPVLELGCGTGRLCLPLADAGLAVVGLDASAAMLARLRRKPGADRLTLVEADMTDFEVATPPGPAPPGGPGAAGFRLVFVAFNTFFNVASEEGQRACMRAVARHLQPGGPLGAGVLRPGEPPAPAGDAVRCGRSRPTGSSCASPGRTPRPRP